MIRRRHLAEFHKGWFLGDFSPSILRTKDLEVGIKLFKAGETEPLHHQIEAVEYTFVVYGRIRIGDLLLSDGEICEISPGVSADFLSITDAALVVVKFPSLPDDKVVDQ